MLSLIDGAFCVSEPAFSATNPPAVGSRTGILMVLVSPSVSITGRFHAAKPSRKLLIEPTATGFRTFFGNRMPEAVLVVMVAKRSSIRPVATHLRKESAKAL